MLSPFVRFEQPDPILRIDIGDQKRDFPLGRHLVTFGMHDGEPQTFGKYGTPSMDTGHDMLGSLLLGRLSKWPLFPVLLADGR